MTDVAIPALSQVEDLFKSLVWDNAIAAMLTYIQAQVPFFRLPLVRKITTYLVTTIADKIFALIRLFIDIEAIRLRNDQHQKEFDKALSDLKILAHDKGINSDEFKRKREAAKDSLAKFVSYGASSVR